jgi:ankyrin repeat protein
MAAAQSNGIAVMQELFVAGANIYAENNQGYNALMLASWRHQVEAVKFLAKLGINPCLANKKGETALSMALSYGREDRGQQEIILFLLDTCGRSGLVK